MLGQYGWQESTYKSSCKGRHNSETEAGKDVSETEAEKDVGKTEAGKDVHANQTSTCKVTD